MSKTTLLIQPPYGRILEIPYGTLSALTGSLRSRGYNVIQRDFNVETFLQFLESENANKLCDLAQEKIQILNTSNDEKDLYLSKKLKTEIGSFKQIIPRFKQLRTSIIKETKKNRFKLKTYNWAQYIYKKYSLIISLLTTSNTHLVNTFERIDDKYNFYCLIFDKLLREIKWEEVILAGISVSRSSELAGLTLANMIRKRYPQVHVVVGGPLFDDVDFDDKEDIQDLIEILKRYAHSIVMYEGDTAIVNIVECLLGKNSWDNVPNLVRLKDNNISISKPFCFEKIESLAPHDFEGLPVQYYPGLPVEVSRGCYWGKCSFCRFFRVNHKRKEYSQDTVYYRFFGSDKIISSLKYLKEKYNKKFFEFVCLDISPNEMRKLCMAMIDSDLDIKFGARLRLDKSFAPDLFDLMATAGAYYFHIHPETFSQKTAILHNKNYDVQHIKSLIAYWHKNRRRLPTLMLTIIAQFPGETFDDFLETYNYIKKGSFYVQGIRPFNFYKNTGVYYNLDKYGIKIKRRRKDLFFNLDIIWDKDTDEERRKIGSFLGEHFIEVQQLTKHWHAKFEIMYEPQPKFISYIQNFLKILYLFSLRQTKFPAQWFFKIFNFLLFF